MGTGNSKVVDVPVPVVVPPKKEKADLSNTIKLILLGAGDCGKTTIFKQLLNSTGNTFSPEFLKKNKEGLLKNIIHGLTELVRCAEHLKQDLTDLNHELYVVNEALLSEEYKELEEKVAKAVLKLWESTPFQESITEALRKGEYQISDNFPVLMELLRTYPKFGGSDWVPSVEQCMLTRVPTSGVEQQTFNSSGASFRLMDVGGQRSERKKWMNIFAGITGVIYVCSLAEYDQTLFDNHNVNRLEESINLFKQTAESVFFKKSMFILFYNKSDLFDDKYHGRKIPINLSGLFEGAPVEEDDPTNEKAYAWFDDKMREKLEGGARKRTYYTHVTNALDRNKMDEVIKGCTSLMIERLVVGSFGKM